jgi:hypothetical protein
VLRSNSERRQNSSASDRFSDYLAGNALRGGGGVNAKEAIEQRSRESDFDLNALAHIWLADRLQEGVASARKRRSFDAWTTDSESERMDLVGGLSWHPLKGVLDIK